MSWGWASRGGRAGVPNWRIIKYRRRCTPPPARPGGPPGGPPTGWRPGQGPPPSRGPHLHPPGVLGVLGPPRARPCTGPGGPPPPLGLRGSPPDPPWGSSRGPGGASPAPGGTHGPPEGSFWGGYPPSGGSLGGPLTGPPWEPSLTAHRGPHTSGGYRVGGLAGATSQLGGPGGGRDRPCWGPTSVGGGDLPP